MLLYEIPIDLWSSFGAGPKVFPAAIAHNVRAWHFISIFPDLIDDCRIVGVSCKNLYKIFHLLCHFVIRVISLHITNLNGYQIKNGIDGQNDKMLGKFIMYIS